MKANWRACRAPLALEWPGGGHGHGDSAVRLRLRQRGLLRHLASGRIGDLAGAYVRGDLDIEGSMPDLMTVAGALAGDPVRRGERGRLARWLGRWQARWRARPGDNAEQVRFHYDLSDEFFALWLDPMRVYSCAYYARPNLSLEEAQKAKLDLVCRKLQLGRGQRFLDVGAGWGGLLVWAAMHYGVQATGLTLSCKQFVYVHRLIEELGLVGQVEIKLMDFSELKAPGAYDRIASVGMFEHVGSANLVRYFRALHDLLRPGGLLLNHGIAAGGLDHEQLGAGMGDFIERHIFPGGELVHASRAAEALCRGGLELLDVENLRPHYARTLWDWSKRLENQLEAARGLTGEAQVRAYRLYLAGSALCFERGWLSLFQMLASKPDHNAEPDRAWAARSDYPFRRQHMLG